jgi:hypothetical protein
MLVGKDGKPATFKDEEGQPTNAMPRNSTLSEDREALSNLVVNPTLKSNMPERRNSPARANVTVKSLAKSPFEPRDNKSINEIKNTVVNMGNSNSVNKTMPEEITAPMEANQGKSKQILSSNPPDIGADLIASQTKSPTPTAALVPVSIKGGSSGGLLDSLKRKTASMRSMLQMRHSTRRNRK